MKNHIRITLNSWKLIDWLYDYTGRAGYLADDLCGEMEKHLRDALKGVVAKDMLAGLADFSISVTRDDTRRSELYEIDYEEDLHPMIALQVRDYVRYMMRKENVQAWKEKHADE